jgi:NitT/TauT family transport system permease protein
MFMSKHKRISAGKSQLTTVSPEHREFLRRVYHDRIRVRVTQISILVLIFALWELLASLRIMDPFITSQPTRVFKCIVKLYQEGALFRRIAVTCLETIIGFILGTVLGTIMAIILWWSEFISKVSEPYLVILNSLPKIALGPIFIVWIGAGPAAIIVMTLAISLIVTILEVLNGFLAIDNEKIKLVKSFGGTKLQIMSKVVLPASLPTIINALKINVGLSWVGVIVGEFLVAKEGLGFLIVFGGQVAQLDMVMLSIIILAVAAYIMYEAVAIFEKMFLKWKS